MASGMHENIETTIRNMQTLRPTIEIKTNVIMLVH